MRPEKIDPVLDLLIQLANSLHERYPDSNIQFTEAETKIVNDWVQKIGEQIAQTVFME